MTLKEFHKMSSRIERELNAIESVIEASKEVRNEFMRSGMSVKSPFYGIVKMLNKALADLERARRSK
jgi:hypothetical protein